MLKLCFPLKAGSCASVARCLWLGEVEQCGCSLAAWLLLPLGTGVREAARSLLWGWAAWGQFLTSLWFTASMGSQVVHGKAPDQRLLLLAVLPEASVFPWNSTFGWKPCHKTASALQLLHHTSFVHDSASLACSKCSWSHLNLAGECWKGELPQSSGSAGDSAFTPRSVLLFSQLRNAAWCG